MSGMLRPLSHQLFLGTIKLDYESNNVMDEFVKLQLPIPIELKVRRGKGRPWKFAMVTYDTEEQAQYVLNSGFHWSYGKFCTIRRLAPPSPLPKGIKST